jgi:hypothetical protein
MDKKIAGLLGAAAAFATVGAAHATALEGNSVGSGLTYRDLLNPVPNALEALKAHDAQRESGQATTEVAQITIGVGHHHHHHHHHARARVRIVPPVRHDHHHHHHHHNMYYTR